MTAPTRRRRTDRERATAELERAGAALSLPHLRGFVVVHHHDEGEPCTRGCRYAPTVWTRFRHRLGRSSYPRQMDLQADAA